ncbi:MAG: ribosome-binding factor A [Zetaproteobacteria bacterium]|nr:MAG: ribosome-binding factor A [Zetaproteobacteria bacterium]
MNAHPAEGRLHADIQRLLSLMLVREIADPRLQGVAITRVEVAGKHSLTVWVHGIDLDPALCVEQLNRMRPHFEHALRRSLARRRLPGLRFRWDEAVDRGESVMRRLRELHRP